MQGLAAPQFCGCPPAHIAAHSCSVGWPPARAKQLQLHGSSKTLQSASVAHGLTRGDTGFAVDATAAVDALLAVVPVPPLAGAGAFEQPTARSIATKQRDRRIALENIVRPGPQELAAVAETRTQLGAAARRGSFATELLPHRRVLREELAHRRRRIGAQ